MSLLFNQTFLNIYTYMYMLQLTEHSPSYICTRVCIYIYIYIYTHTHTHTSTYIWWTVRLIAIYEGPKVWLKIKTVGLPPQMIYS